MGGVPLRRPMQDARELHGRRMMLQLGTTCADQRTNGKRWVVFRGDAQGPPEGECQAAVRGSALEGG
jgi:hypothetical protein